MRIAKSLPAFVLSACLLGCGGPSEKEYAALLEETYAGKIADGPAGLSTEEQADLEDLQKRHEAFESYRKAHLIETDDEPEGEDDEPEFSADEAAYLKDLLARRQERQTFIDRLEAQKKSRLEKFGNASASERKRMIESLRKTKGKVAERKQNGDDEDDEE